MAGYTRRRFLAGLGAAGTGTLAGCSGGSAGGATPAGDAGGPRPPTADEPLPVAYSYERIRSGTRSGGPGKDGIPSIDDPSFVAAGAAGLDPGAIVFGAVRDGEAKAYPQHVLVWHEIVNDTLGGDPVSVTYCPLTGTVVGFERGATTFGVSGDLVNSNLVMYDRGTDSRWPQVLATATRGPMTGETLRDFQVVWTTWGRWREAHPGTRVLTDDTGYGRRYGEDPYGDYAPRSGYYAPGAPPMFPALTDDDRHPPKSVFVGARSAAGALAVRKSALREAGLVALDLGGTEHLAVYDPALDAGYVYANPAGRSFEYADGTVRGPEGSHAPAELPLERVLAMDAMWFAWAGFYPGTVVHA